MSLDTLSFICVLSKSDFLVMEVYLLAGVFTFWKSTIRSSSQNFFNLLNSSSKENHFLPIRWCELSPLLYSPILRVPSKRSLFEVNNESPVSYLAVWTPYVVNVVEIQRGCPHFLLRIQSLPFQPLNVTISSIAIKVLDKSLSSNYLHWNSIAFFLMNEIFFSASI